MKKLLVSLWTLLLASMLLSVSVLLPAVAEEAIAWPEKAITIVVPFGSGGDSDYNARIMAKYLTEELGVTVVVENITGSGGSIGSASVKDARPDGYTVLQNHNALMISRANGISDFGLEAFELVGITAANPGDVIAVASSTGITTLQELVDASKEKKMTIATNIGATTQVSSFMLGQFANLTQVDVGGISDKVVALLGGHVDIIVGPYGNIKPYEESGEFNVLGVTAQERALTFPEIPTCIEQGYEVYFPTRFFMAFPKGTDPRIVEKFAAAVEKIITTNEEYAKEIANAYYQTPLFVPAEEALTIYAEIEELISRFTLTELK
ncbi:MAG TPA: tripartite tricarboxylate transporter substrate binding protein [Clostridia bacterium]|jgi:tripartite-type tricarboxylate transporter receptor subunit TctC|nr:tripartite tricarboxylate transporter substrate binding protein [Clostridia bacterium]HQA96567.1 tripartite tricarboxylate transporter substrate binding protein [Clostridia bacterium]HQO54714.1 tripartite tricarboxylate transporter substrate binding protein [Clostridia bacterium]